MLFSALVMAVAFVAGGVALLPFFFLFKRGVFPVAPPEGDEVELLLLLLSVTALPFVGFKVGTLGVFTGSIGELVRDLEPKNLIGFSGEAVFLELAASNLARPLATAPETTSKLFLDHHFDNVVYSTRIKLFQIFLKQSPVNSFSCSICTNARLPDFVNSARVS